METLVIEGGRRLAGVLTVQGAKNSVLPILAATLLCGDVCVIENCPRLRDVTVSVQILRHLGCAVRWDGDALEVDARQLICTDIPDEWMREMRSSVIFLGAILARTGEACLAYPGGCELGPRPIDLHIAALRALGAQIDEHGGRLCAYASALQGAEIVLAIPSVGATENAMLAACGAEGVTVIHNAAREPEIVDLQNFLVAMGASVQGAGGSVITVEGGRNLHGCRHRVIADRIVAATYLCAAAAAGGTVQLQNVDYRALSTIGLALTESGCRIRSESDSVSIESDGQLRAIRTVHTAPYPGFPTDAQPVLMAALLRAAGSTVIVENMFENRYRHVDELLRMGADIRVAGRVAVVDGVETLCGAAVQSHDLRGGAALVVAGLQAQGITRVAGTAYIDRGYASMEEDLRRLGAYVYRETEGRAVS